jgi:hypothetical protein
LLAFHVLLGLAAILPGNDIPLKRNKRMYKTRDAGEAQNKIQQELPKCMTRKLQERETKGIQIATQRKPSKPRFESIW